MLPAPMSSTASRDRLRTVAVRGLQARVSVRPARGRLVDEPPLLLCNGIGVSLEALQPLVDALDPDRGVVRFDVPGVGGSAAPPLPYPIAALSSWVTALMRNARPPASSTCSACPGAAGWPNSSRCSHVGGYAASCSWPPAPAP